MKYKCLVLDHDDTVVASSATIHYPSFIAYLEDYLPELVKNYTFESFIIKNFDPGIVSLLHDEVGLDDEQMKHEEEYWLDFIETRFPKAFDGMSDIIRDFKARGGIVAVASHSMTKYIVRDYEHNSLPTPDVIYGWDIPKENRKPSPWCINDLCARYGLKPEEILVVDDLKPGYDMARGAGAHFAAAGWAYDVPEIAEFMKKNCDYYLESVSELKKLLDCE